MDPDFYEKLMGRTNRRYLERRLRQQVEIAASFYVKDGIAWLHPENTEVIPKMVAALLKLLGLAERARQNTLAYDVTTVAMPFERLPAAFDGFRVLQLSDIHADTLADGGRRLRSILKGLAFDVCVLTGDFRFSTYDRYDRAMAATAALVAELKAPHGIWGILGNHDFVEFVPALEACGVRMLINEARPLSRGTDTIWLAGIDDAHLYGCHDFPKTLADIPARAFKLLLSHSPETYALAAAAGFDYTLCGHTHGGQLCLPGGVPLMTNARCPRRFCAGAWDYRGMHGYTSRGVGTSGLTARLCCPPEITIHVLRTVQRNAADRRTSDSPREATP